VGGFKKILFLAIFNVKKSSYVLRGEVIGWNTKNTVNRGEITQ
jgi:hypothetical protein